MSVYLDTRKKLLNNQFSWLITGVAGFIGSHLLEALLSLNQIVIGLDDFSTGSLANLNTIRNRLPEEFANNFKLIKGDICSMVSCEEAMKGIDYVLHHAAMASVPLSIKYPEKTHKINATAFMNLLQAAKNARVKRFVYASSSAVYGDSNQFKKHEENPVFPVSPYAVTKYINELYARSFYQYYKLETIGLRYFNIFGPRQSPDGAYAPVIPLWIEAMLKNEPVYINGDGGIVRDFCYIDNVIQANLLAALGENKESTNRIYNIGCGQEVTLTQLITIMKKIINPANLRLVHREERIGDIKISSADVSNAKKYLGFVPTTSLESGLIATIEYYKSLLEATRVVA
ncbi:NAD-dependent epimerase/dehydratase family protein [Legionella sp. km772]|uniref:NAD-dependent epimerase/dehydratase family protein n=1 Tax=Legionella sp. km772 TaxID=2498111 RepID=UPI000F8F5D8E|nr:NAD-dependent epimerase/dehydratase family protein [Legionella sp. km772]RUR12741.1 NAD-dependent epimerase/dehydratase family protein [Legionella sp. km772]